jgi:hypothetical protein
LDSLIGKLTTADVRKALQVLPKGVDDTYREAMERIERQDEQHRQLAKQVLLWIVYAFRPLTVNELQHALAVELDAVSLDHEAIFDDELLTSVCAGLVIIDGKQSTVRLVRK